MNAALHHRGPDDQGITNIRTESSLEVSLGNTRLAIIDVTAAGHQPMHDPDTENWITYNGETYNYRQLRTEVGDEFGPWRSNSDTEVVLKAYRKWGTEAFARLRGMFALAIWDEHKRMLVLARDQFGIKPLYCFSGSGGPISINPGTSEAISTNTFMFASELRALLASEMVPRTLSPSGLSSLLEFGSVQAPLTIVKDVWSLMPGTCLTISEQSSSQLRFAVTDFVKRGNRVVAKSRDQAKCELRELLEDSVRQHLVSDVPLGVFLSGGMDSSAIVALMSRVTSERPRTFSVVFAEQKFTESQHSEAVASRFNSQHHELILSEQSLVTSLPNALAALDQPSMDGINTYVVSQAVKASGVTVALSGLGGDELFCGYPSFRRALRMETTNALTRSLLRSVARVGGFAATVSERHKKAIQFANGSGDPAAVYRISRQLFSPQAVRDLAKSPVAIHEPSDSMNGDHDTVNLISRFELNGYMANTLLRDTDSMSMAHSLEVRVPFVDKEVADYMLAIPGVWKVDASNGYQSKPFLAEILSDLLPRGLLDRPKMGFTLPFERWMTSQLKNEIASVLADPTQLANAGLTDVPVRDLWHRFLRRPQAVGWSRPWTLYVLMEWCRLNNVSVAFEN
jgi:asparagine synthase (glutamine-hydrolysing)